MRRCAAGGKQNLRADPATGPGCRSAAPNRAARPRSGETQARTMSQRLHRDAIDQREIVDLRSLHCSAAAGAIGERRIGLTARRQCVRQRRSTRHTGAAPSRARCSVRNRLREDNASPSGSRTVGTPMISRRQMQIGDHAAHHLQLLPILLAKIRAIGPHLAEQLGAHRGDTAEMPGRASPSHCSAGPATSIVVASPAGYIVATSGSQTS